MKKKIIVVDDSEAIRAVVKFTLENSGYEVDTANDGLDALKLFDDRTIHLLVTDLHMPNMNGLDLIREVRKNENHKHIPILFLTTESKASVRTEAKEAGATGWIIKPFNQEKFIAIVKKVLR